LGGVVLKRFEGNPILEPIGSHSWESRLVFNAGAVLVGGRVHLVYRAMGNDNVSRLGYASSLDGYHFDCRSPDPVFEPVTEAEVDGVEDPRLTLFGDKIFLAYTAFGNYMRDKVYQVGLSSISLNDFLATNWVWGERIFTFPGIRNKNAFVFPKKFDGEYVLFHRLDPDICVSRSEDFVDWCGLKFVLGPRIGMWDSLKVGTTGPPIEVSEGWLMLYHGVDFDKTYRLGSVLLDKTDPSKVIYRCKDPILEPELDFERYGDVPNVVYSCGHVVLDGKVLVYYGGADSVLGVVTYDLAELLPKK